MEHFKAIITNHERPVAHDTEHTLWSYATAFRTKDHQRRPLKEPYRRPRASFPLHTRFVNDYARENNGKRISKNVCLGLKVICLFLKQDITRIFDTRSARVHKNRYTSAFVLRQHMLRDLGTPRAPSDLNSM